MKNILRILICTFTVISSSAKSFDFGSIVVDVKKENINGEISYAYTFTSSKDDIHIIEFGYQCNGGYFLDVEEFGFEKLPIRPANEDWFPKGDFGDNISAVSGDNYLGKYSIVVNSGAKQPLVKSDSSLVIKLYVTKENDDLFQELPICLFVAPGHEKTVISKPHDWPDDDFDFEKPTEECQVQFDKNKLNALLHMKNNQECQKQIMAYQKLHQNAVHQCVLLKRFETIIARVGSRNKELQDKGHKNGKAQVNRTQKNQKLPSGLQKSFEKRQRNLEKISTRLEQTYEDIPQNCKK